MDSGPGKQGRRPGTVRPTIGVERVTAPETREEVFLSTPGKIPSSFDTSRKVGYPRQGYLQG